MKLEAVLFDLDGTLIDTAADFVATLAILCARHNVNCPSDTHIRNTVSNGARALVTLAFDIDESNQKFAPLRQELLDIYETELGKNACLFDEVKPSLRWLKERNISWGIVTNKPRLYTELLLSRMGITPAAVVCPDDVTHTKPNPEPILLACKQLSVHAENCLYAGDHERDIEAGKNANMQTIACEWGYIANGIDIDAWQAHFNVKNTQQLLSVIENFTA